MCVCVYICIYIYIYRERERERDCDLFADLLGVNHSLSGNLILCEQTAADMCYYYVIRC